MLKSIKFKQIYQTWTLKTWFNPKKLFARNLGMSFRRAVLILEDSKSHNLDFFSSQGSRWTSMMSSSRESSVTRNMPTARISNSRPFHDKPFERQDRSAGVGTEMCKAITTTRVSFFLLAFTLSTFFFQNIYNESWVSHSLFL